MSTLDHYNPYLIESTLDWPGLKSSKFGKTRLHIPSNDIISNGLTFPHQGFHNHSERKHLYQNDSPQKQFRSSIRKMPEIVHWHPRESSKRIVSFTPTKPHPRPQRLHLQQHSFISERSAGIRTFYNQKVREQNSLQYKVQDKMQRKTRVNLSQIRKTCFKNGDKN